MVSFINEEGFYMDTVICDSVYDTSEEFGDLDVNSSIEIGLVVSGVGVHRVLNQVIPCQEGDVYILNEHVPHRVYSSEPGTPLTIRRIKFSPKEWLFSKYASSSGPGFLYGCFRENNVMAYAMLTQAVQETVGRIYDEIAVEFYDRKDEWKEATRARLVLLLISIVRYTNRAIKNISKATSDAWNPISCVIAMVHEKYCDSELTLEFIASSFHLSRAHLGKIFKRNMGITFSDYLRHVRLENACSLLIETNQTVEEIMIACGMRDSTSFYKAFSEYFGMTPNNYRKQHMKEKQNMSILNEISETLQKGKGKLVADLVQKALDDGVAPDAILNEGLLSGMSVIGEKFKNNEVYIPEVLVAARAMNKGIAILKPHLVATGAQATGKVCIGTVQGDLHDIGKNLVKMMMEGKGLEVVDLGTDVSPETFVQTAIEQNCQVICCSALLTTTMGVMEEVVKKAVELGVRDRVKIMIGGAPVNQAFCEKIGADCYTPDAASAAATAVKFCRKADMLSREDVRAAIRFGNPPRPPRAFTKWWGEGLREQYGDQLRRFDKYDEDVVVVGFPRASFTERPDGFYWRIPKIDRPHRTAYDSNAVLPDWKYLPDLLANLPNTDAPGLFDEAKRIADQAHAEGKYVLIHHWSLMYELIWKFRGMEELLVDYYENPDEVHALHRAVADTELKLLKRAFEEVKPDGYMISDDLGTQTSLMMSPATFREFIKPYYIEIWGLCREHDVDSWLHTCGNISEIIGDLIECGLSVLHPLQKGTMDWDDVATKWKGKIAFLVGMDVQNTLINGTPEDVRREVRLIRDTFDTPKGGLLYAAGNGIVGGTPLENIEAFLEEIFKYKN